MNLRGALKMAGQAARVNLRPGAVLWVVLLIFLALYLWSAGFRGVLQQVADVKASAGYPFAFGIYMLSAALLPELLQVVFFQGWRCTGKNVRNFLFGTLVWGTHGVISDWFYRCQTLLFGAENDWVTLMTKVVVDQFGFSFFENAWILVVFAWRETGFDWGAWRGICSKKFFWERYFPLIVAVWCVWIPGTAVIYFMPPALQLPVASLIVCFWVLIFSFMCRKA